ncbi:MAG: hypothetical protein C0448_16275, partial [Sphingobacteriaceae bacterium]|nr:hypothetical protein [Sphingobacteriaceae bacterium]
MSFLALATLSLSVNAVEVSVSKLRVNLEKGQNADFLVLHNGSKDEKQSFNISIQKWTQADKVEVLENK